MLGGFKVNYGHGHAETFPFHALNRFESTPPSKPARAKKEGTVRFPAVPHWPFEPPPFYASYDIGSPDKALPSDQVIWLVLGLAGALLGEGMAPDQASVVQCGTSHLLHRIKTSRMHI